MEQEVQQEILEAEQGMENNVECLENNVECIINNVEEGEAPEQMEDPLAEPTSDDELLTPIKTELLEEEPPKERRVQCTKCPEMFTPRNLANHMRTHKEKTPSTSERKIKCPYCSEHFTQRNLSTHLRLHAAEDTLGDQLECKFCMKEFTRRKALRYHMKKVHNCTEVIRCIKCNYLTHNPIIFKGHALSHRSEPKSLFSCVRCKFLTICKSTYRKHVISQHAAVNDFNCKECGAEFMIKIDYETHKKWYHDVTDFQCRLCKKYFVKLASLRNHEMGCK